MAGCFGNSPFDTDMERQLNEHLSNEAQWDIFCDKIIDNFSLDLWDSGLDSFFETNEVQNVLTRSFKQPEPDDKLIAKTIEEMYNKFRQEQPE
jgi:hypothetical protein